MRIALAIEDELIYKAMRLTGINDTNLLVKLGLETLVTKESDKRLVKLGGTEKGLKTIPRRRLPKNK